MRTHSRKAPKFMTMLGLCVLLSTPAYANLTFDQWLSSFKNEARAEGISDQTIAEALTNVRFLPKVIEFDRKQPEGTMTFAKYYTRVVNQQRINKGRALYKKHRQELERAADTYGVPAQYIVALWGVETSFGENTGGFNIIPALATLAYEGRRAQFFKGELINALQIIDAGHISASRMQGSWAGAMGQNQFMPSSFKAYAVDGNGDGRRDIWTTLPDVFASTANYLHKSGWIEEDRWGRQIKLPTGFPKTLTGLETTKSLAEWSRLGITLPNGQPLPVSGNMSASVVTPDGLSGPAYLAYDNYRVIMKWNKSTYFATSVGLLADQIAQ